MAVRHILIHQTQAQFDMADQDIHVPLLSYFLAQSVPAIVGT